VYPFRDYCYIQCCNLDQLLTHISNIRYRLLHDFELFCRGAVVKGGLEAKPIVHSNAKDIIISGMEFSSIASRLYGIQERVEGIGVSIDWIPDESKLIDEKCVSTYYVTLSSRKRSFTKFLDIALDSSFMTNANLHRTLKNFRKSNTLSRKFASFYVPLLLQWAKSTLLTTDDGEEQLDDLICRGQLNGLRRIQGIELVFLCFLDKVFSVSLHDDVSDDEFKRVDNLKKFFVSSSWLQEIIATDNHSIGIPRDVLSNNAKQNFADYLYN